MNRHSMLALGGVGGFVGLKIATSALSENPVPQSNDFTILITTLPFAYPIFKGAIGNLREYFSDGKTFSLLQSRRDITHMLFGGFPSLHFAGEYAQVTAYALGGSDFGQGFYGHDWNQFFFDPHMIPYWLFNAPAFYLLGKAVVSEVKSCGGDVLEQIQDLTS